MSVTLKREHQSQSQIYQYFVFQIIKIFTLTVAKLPRVNNITLLFLWLNLEG